MPDDTSPAAGPAQPRPKIWDCKIGEVHPALLPPGSDAPMRQAVRRAYKELTGQDAAFCFSGWGAELTEPERAVVENREPRPPPTHPTGPDVDTRWTLDPEVAHAEALVEEQLRFLRTVGRRFLTELQLRTRLEPGLAEWRDQLALALQGDLCEEHNKLTPGECALCFGASDCCCYCADDAEPAAVVP